MQKFASKTTFRGPFLGSIARGDCKMTTPEIVTDPGDVVSMIARGIEVMFQMTGFSMFRRI